MNNNNNNNKEVLKSVLGSFFKDNFYKDGIINLRRAIRDNKYYRDNWEGIVKLILNKALDEGEPLYLIDNNANLVLDDNTDTEAYKWLNLMLINSLGSEDTIIIEY